MPVSVSSNLASSRLIESLPLVIGDRERCLKAGMDEHVTKPLRRETLASAITKLVTDKIRRRIILSEGQSRNR
jgi:CheY-like chemotaxis protein